MESHHIIPPTTTINLRDIQPSEYVLSKGLKDAVQVALALEQPLLITGEPGTGKTRLAHRVAHDLHRADAAYLPEPLSYTTQTTSAAQDLFYFYDALSHFHDANLRKTDGTAAPDVKQYIELRALGKAIALSDPAASKDFLSAEEQQTPRNSVVLIDEIDKAPRDFPNNLLNQLEQYEFRISEANNHRLKIGQGRRILVILTSNSEKTLPEAFLRRCVFYHIPFPDEDQLMKIVKARLGGDSPYAHADLIEHFSELREKINRKKPATAELIAWLKVLELHTFLDEQLDLNKLTPKQKETLALSYSVLAKTREDLKALLA
ncbi:MAG: MoxR family ATPase [Bacteroidota bacterium]